MRYKPQCSEEINVKGSDWTFFCVKRLNHKGKHQISLSETTLTVMNKEHFDIIRTHELIMKAVSKPRSLKNRR